MNSNQLNNLTACLVIYNEEKVLTRCLKSISKVTKKILVVHDGKCFDNSLEICKKFGAKVFTRPHKGEAEPHRAWLYNKVKTDWVLLLDADEELSEKAIVKIPQLIKDKNVDAFVFVWPYWNGKEFKTKTWPHKLALFRIRSISYLASPHEEVRVKGNIANVPLVIYHKPAYDNFSFKTFKNKTLKWTKIHAKFLLMGADNIDRFPKGALRLLPHYHFIPQHPLLFSLPLSLYHFAGTYLLGGYKEGFNGAKVCFFMALYYFFLCLEVSKLKRDSS